jgi:hypothetical protein
MPKGGGVVIWSGFDRGGAKGKKFGKKSVKPHAKYTPFGVKKKLVVLLIMPHINYGNVVFSTVDFASQSTSLEACFSSCAYYYRCFVGDSFEESPFDLSFTRTRNLIVTPYRSLAMGAFHSWWCHVGCGILFHIGLKMSALWGALWDWYKDALYVIVTFCRIIFFFLLVFTELSFLIVYFRCVFALIVGDAGLNQPGSA